MPLNTCISHSYLLDACSCFKLNSHTLAHSLSLILHCLLLLIDVWKMFASLGISLSLTLKRDKQSRSFLHIFGSCRSGLLHAIIHWMRPFWILSVYNVNRLDFFFRSSHLTLTSILTIWYLFVLQKIISITNFVISFDVIVSVKTHSLASSLLFTAFHHILRMCNAKSISYHVLTCYTSWFDYFSMSSFQSVVRFEWDTKIH